MSHSRYGESSDLLVVSANTAAGASDFVMADLHGNDVVFNTVNQGRNQPGDRIFLAGDLVDRGEGNVEIIRAIVTNNANDANGKIYSVRGNHEELCIETIAQLEMLVKLNSCGAIYHDALLILHVLHHDARTDADLQEVFANRYAKIFFQAALNEGEKLCQHTFAELGLTEAEQIQLLRDDPEYSHKIEMMYVNLIEFESILGLHSINGGDWLLDLFVEEFEKKLITVNKNGDIAYHADSDVGMIKKYMESLPYIIHVQGPRPFNVVHADMPISTKKLLQRVAKGKGLTDEEREYALWARALRDAEIKIKLIKGCNKTSVLTMAGHTIDGGVRACSNTINLDVAAYLRNCSIVVKMPQMEVMIILFNNDIDHPDRKVLKLAHEIQDHLNVQITLSKQHAMMTQLHKTIKLFRNDQPVNDDRQEQVTTSEKKKIQS